uniref:Protoporphyrinogen oxidase n=1 Tax=Cyanoderma ruficeps TaxID=181631 RepID=A0A8C3QJZ6_9PASS
MPPTVAVLGGGISGLAACYHLVRAPRPPKVSLGPPNPPPLPTGTHNPRNRPLAGGVPLSLSPLSLSLSPALPVPVTVPIAVPLSLLSLLLSSLSLFLSLSPSLSSLWLWLTPLLSLSVSPLPLSLCHCPCVTVSVPVSLSLSPQVAEVAVDSLCRGVFAGDSRVLSVRSCFPALFWAERRRGSVLLGMALGQGGDIGDSGTPAGLARRARAERWSQWSLRGGMEALPRALVAFVSPRGADVSSVPNAHPSVPMSPCPLSPQLTFPGGSITADHVISALPAAALSRALPADLSPLSRELGAIPAATVGVVNLLYRGVTLPVTGFGHLVPSREDPALLGVVYDSVAFPEHDGTPVGDTWGGHGDTGGDTGTLGGLLGFTCVPPPSPCPQDCIPQYTLGHWERLERIQKFLREQQLPLSLIGASYWGVSVNDCIASAKEAVGRILGSLPDP